MKINKYDLVTANLPYVPSKSKIENTVKHEPQESIFGGKDGLIFIRELIKDIQDQDRVAVLNLI